MQATVISNTALLPTIHHLVLQRPPSMVFQPGQYVVMGVDGFSPIPLAIASGSLDTQLEFCIRKWGKLTEQLFAMEPGQEVSIEGGYGTTFHFPLTSMLYAVARGTGITPVRSILRSRGWRNSRLFYGANSSSELLFKAEHLMHAAAYTETVLKPDSNWDGSVLPLHELILRSDINPNGYAFICGPKLMMKEVAIAFLQKGLLKDRILISMEKFDEEGHVVGPIYSLSNPHVIAYLEW